MQPLEELKLRGLGFVLITEVCPCSVPFTKTCTRVVEIKDYFEMFEMFYKTRG
jgi:hypothetical protein